MPRILIPKSLCPEDFIRQPKTFKFVRFVAEIKDWPEDSLFARGQLIRRFGDESVSFIESETERILVNVGFAYGQEECMHFPEKVESYIAKEILPKMTSAVLAEEISHRRDFRSQCVFTIDPRTARDLDDALHIRRLSKNDIMEEIARGFTDVAYEVGVHIADVSYYVRPEDPIDVEAANRATSIYLVQSCVPMLPRSLCEDLCSLHPGFDKLTFSVVFRLTSDGKVVSRWIGRTAINSRAKLSYEDAQAFIDNPNKDWQAGDLPSLQTGTDIKELCQCINMLNELAIKMRMRRFEKGALQLNQVKPTFALSEENGFPIGVAPFIVCQANRLVEEWMLAANESVALILSKNLPQTALLRRHPPPTIKQLREARALLHFCNVDVDVTSARSIQDSLNQLSGCSGGMVWQHSDDLAELCASMMGCSVHPDSSSSTEFATSEKTNDEKSRHLDKEARLLATLNVLTKCMNLAEYFCLGELTKYGGGIRHTPAFQGHYALNMTHYTHFTSPIRRYADLIVHRQLAQILAYRAEADNQQEVASFYRATSTSKVLQRPDQLAAIADFCNARKLNSRKASEDSIELFFTVFVKECGPLTEACSVVSVLNRSFDVLILSVGLVRRVYLNALDLASFEFERVAGAKDKGLAGIGILHLQWNVRPLKSITGEKVLCDSSTSPVENLLLTDPAVKDSEVVPPCGCFRQELHLFDLVRCSVAVEGMEAGLNICEVPLGDTRLEESDVNADIVLPKPTEETHEQGYKIRLNLLRPTCELCKNYAS